MARRFIDLSIYLENDVISDSPLAWPKITCMSHRGTLARMQSFVPGLTAEQLPDDAARTALGAS